MRYTPPKPEIKQIEIAGEDRLCLVTTDGYNHSTIALLEDVIELLSRNGIKID